MAFSEVFVPFCVLIGLPQPKASSEPKFRREPNLGAGLKLGCNGSPFFDGPVGRLAGKG